MIGKHFQVLKNKINDNGSVLIEEKRYVYFSPGLFLVSVFVIGLSVFAQVLQ